MRRILVGFACNNACVFCAQGDLRAGRPPPDPRNSLRDVAPGDVVAFVGGEPTIALDLPELIALARERGAVDVIVQTNGRRLAYPPYTASLRSAGATALDVSLHGSTAAMHEAHTRAEGSFAQTVTGLGVAVAAGLRVGVTAVLTRSNYRHAGEIVRLAHARGVRRVSLADVTLVGAASRGRSLVFPRELGADHLTEAKRLARALRVELSFGADADPRGEPLFAGLGVTEPSAPASPRERSVTGPAAPP